MATRKTKYKEDYLRIAEVVCEEGGLSLRQLGKVLGVSATTIIQWKKKYPGFGDAVDRGTHAFDVSTAKDSLQKRLTGYFYNETTSTLALNTLTDKIEMKVTKIVKKHVPPDTNALKFYLTNKQPEQWKDRQEHSVFGKNGKDLFGRIEIRLVAPNEREKTKKDS